MEFLVFTRASCEIGQDACVVASLKFCIFSLFLDHPGALRYDSVAASKIEQFCGLERTQGGV